MPLTSLEPGTWATHSTQNELSIIFGLLIVSLSLVSRPGKSPERGGRAMDNYEPISPPHTYQGLDKQDPGGPASQRREAESEIRYKVHPVSRSKGRVVLIWISIQSKPVIL